jgi:L-alanine-DL-glutamate epimerase-like enolase superfamily enzyme
MRLTALTTDHLRVPLGKPGRVSLTDPAPAGPAALDLIVVHAETDTGLTGFGFAVVGGPGAAAVRGLIDAEVAPLVAGTDPRQPEQRFAAAEAHFRGVGFAGLAARAYSAVDIALWDLKAKAAGMPLWELLGAARPAAPFFVSDVAVGRPAADVVKQAKPLLKQGATAVRIEVGGGDVRADADRVREISDGLGEDAAVCVAAGGRYELGTAEALTHFFEDVWVEWFEDPLPAADQIGYAKLAGMAEIPIAVGSSFGTRDRFFQTIRDGVIRVVRPDVGRLGGITPVLKVAAVAEAFGVSVSPVRLTEVGVHLACGLPAVTRVDRVDGMADVFAGGPQVADGKLAPPAAPGLGLTLAPGVEKWRVGGGCGT